MLIPLYLSFRFTVLSFLSLSYRVLQLVATAEQRNLATSAPTLDAVSAQGHPCQAAAAAVASSQGHAAALGRTARAKDERSELHDSGWMGRKVGREVA